MKKLLFILFILQTTTHYAQQNVNPEVFAVEFGEIVNNHIDIFPQEDLKLLNETSIIPGKEGIGYFIQLLNIPVSEAFIKKNPKSNKLLKELYTTFNPLVDGWSPSENDNLEDITVAIMDAMDKQPNGRAMQYLFTYCLYTLDDTEK